MKIEQSGALALRDGCTETGCCRFRQSTHAQVGFTRLACSLLRMRGLWIACKVPATCELAPVSCIKVAYAACWHRQPRHGARMNDDTRSDLRALLHRLERGARSLLPFPRRKTLRRWFPSFEDRNLVHLLREQGITHVIDVGANVGQFAQKLRYAGYRGAILSVEPVSSVHDQLRAHAARDATWSVLPRAAGGDRDGTVTINILADSTLSSTLTSLHQATIAHETVDLRRLDTLLEEAGLEDGALIA
eukprot:gene25435-27589_t